MLIKHGVFPKDKPVEIPVDPTVPVTPVPTEPAATLAPAEVK